MRSRHRLRWARALSTSSSLRFRYLPTPRSDHLARSPSCSSLAYVCCMLCPHRPRNPPRDEESFQVARPLAAPVFLHYFAIPRFPEKAAWHDDQVLELYCSGFFLCRRMLLVFSPRSRHVSFSCARNRKQTSCWRVRR